MKNPFTSFADIKERQLKKIKMANANRVEDINFLLHVLEFEHLTHSNMIFMPSRTEYMDKLTSIGFVEILDKKETFAKTSNMFSLWHNPKLNLIVYIAFESQWNALVAAMEIIKNIYVPQESAFETICIAFDAFKKYRKTIQQEQV